MTFQMELVVAKKTCMARLGWRAPDSCKRGTAARMAVGRNWSIIGNDQVYPSIMTEDGVDVQSAKGWLLSVWGA